MFNLPDIEGIYTIYFYSVDNVENIEEENSLTVNLVSLEVKTKITEDSTKELNYFDVIFRKSKEDGIEGLMLIATNPGEMFYHVEVINDWPITIGTLYISVNLPEDFIFKGANPIHIFVDGNEITNEVLIEGDFITILNVIPGTTIEIIAHIDYGLKGTFYPTLDEFWMKDYLFTPELTANGDLIGNYHGESELKAFEKKTTAVAGYVKDAMGELVAGAEVQLKFPDGSVAYTITDENGLYFFLDLSASTFEIRVIYNEIETEWELLSVLKGEVLWFSMFLP
jgi:hypothetical protein